MTTFKKGEEIPSICPFCNEFEKETDLGILNMKVWRCVNLKCETNKIDLIVEETKRSD